MSMKLILKPNQFGFDWMNWKCIFKIFLFTFFIFYRSAKYFIYSFIYHRLVYEMSTTFKLFNNRMNGVKKLFNLVAYFTMSFHVSRILFIYYSSFQILFWSKSLRKYVFGLRSSVCKSSMLCIVFHIKYSYRSKIQL